jgi:hypothetical protein
VHRIKQWISEAKLQKHTKFDDLNKIVKRVLSQYPLMFPKYTKTQSGSKTVHHFNVPGVSPISLEKEHGSREFLPPRFKGIALDGLDALVAYVESKLLPTSNVVGTAEEKDES